jgi:hypothetical protein
MREFLKFLVIWISQNLSIPFWVVGHVHLSMHMTIYQDIHILLASIGMNLIVAIGFWLDYKSQRDK